jgi:hypothetical protein
LAQNDRIQLIDACGELLKFELQLSQQQPKRILRGNAAITPPRSDAKEQFFGGAPNEL